MTDAREVADEISWRVADVMGWPEWMRTRALGHSIKPVVLRVLQAVESAGYEIHKRPGTLPDIRDDEGNYLGKQGSTHEHRTVGDYRAWSYDAHEWCYPSDPCHLCKEISQ